MLSLYSSCQLTVDDKKKKINGCSVGGNPRVTLAGPWESPAGASCRSHPLVATRKCIWGHAVLVFQLRGYDPDFQGTDTSISVFCYQI